MPLIPKDEQEYVRHIFDEKLQNPIRLLVFVDADPSCKYCDEIIQLAMELADLGAGKVDYDVYRSTINPEELEVHDVPMVPALKIASRTIEGDVRFFGMPAGYEFGALIDDIIDASRGATRLSQTTRLRVKNITPKVHVRVFVTPNCPYCPKAVRLAHMFAMESRNVVGDMVEALEFPQLTENYGIMSVPHVVVNDKYAFVGAFPEQAFLQHVFKALRGESGLVVSSEGVTPLKA